MDKFIVRENIRHFQKLLDQQLETAQRRLIERLLADEEAKLTLDLPADADAKRR